MNNNSQEPNCFFCGSKKHVLFNVVSQNEKVIRLRMCSGCGYVFGTPPGRKKIVQKRKAKAEQIKRAKRKINASSKKTRDSLSRRMGSRMQY